VICDWWRVSQSKSLLRWMFLKMDETCGHIRWPRFVSDRWRHILLQLWPNVMNLEYLTVLYLWCIRLYDNSNSNNTEKCIRRWPSLRSHSSAARCPGWSSTLYRSDSMLSRPTDDRQTKRRYLPYTHFTTVFTTVQDVVKSTAKVTWVAKF